MKRVRATLTTEGTLIEAGTGKKLPGRIDAGRVDATTEADIARHIAADDDASRRDAAAYARRVRKRTGLTQAAFASRIGVPVDTVRNWEQGKRFPAGPAKALLKVLDRAPETALAALE
ncbi:MAG: helix-turn-helix domain-containing protein [Rhodospirillales bacterium]|nr:helix-turn-helix domain-containing protein [Rhodospirillales bacterium]